ncbi:hypothetical protein B0H16DRAFT_1775244 [Mycena metata]|uniref:MYND-type domain-containing protein n=1 Tax=Mycena metata TaxID=1033252 RepID=A0AAD7HYU2_9AGAR|nr:hypothetical protein B0H16DRAFT_1775244 [Mycena metata]
MDRRFGAEGKLGIGGGGLVSEESQRNLEMAENICRRGMPNDAVPYLQIALKDKNNFDAEIQMAYLSPDLLFSVEVLETSEKRARAVLIKRLGAKCFDDDGPCVGRFCDAELLLTRPYMRVLQALVRIRTIIEMLRLCPGDNLLQRWWLGPLLIRTGRPADALSFCQTWLQTFETGRTPIRGGTLFPPPSKKLLDAETEDRFARYAPCNMVYTAALAAFKLWGLCAQSAQFLRIAARTNPAILAKIIARRAQPKEGNLTMQTERNGSEEAHDYLWMAQDLWMEPDVWSWVNEDAGAAEHILRFCSRPDCAAQEAKATQFKRCAACHQAMYCGSVCQKADWKRHKPGCVKEVELKKNMKKIFKDKPTTIPVYAVDGREIGQLP